MYEYFTLGTNQNLTDDEFYNRKWELDNIKTFLNTTANVNAPKCY